MNKPRTRQVINLSGSCAYTDMPDGTVHVRVDALDIEVAGADRDNAFNKLTQVLGASLEGNPDAQARFQAWAEKNFVEQDMTPEDIRAEEETEAKAADAGKAFPDLSAETFDTAIGSAKPLLVDFWAPWCKPCLFAAPVLKEIHDELTDSFDVAKVNVDDFKEIQERFGIRGIPCFILFRDGKEIDRIIGFSPKPEFRRAIDELLVKAGS